MASLNRVQLIGRLGKDPEERNFQNGGGVVNLSVATSERWKKGDEWQERTEWHRIACFVEALNAYIMRRACKGALVILEGQLETRKWKDQQGEDRYSTEIVIRPYRGTFRVIIDGVPSEGESGGGRQGRSGGSPAARSGWQEPTSTSRTSWDAPKAGGGSTYTHPGAASRDLPDDDIPF